MACFVSCYIFIELYFLILLSNAVINLCNSVCHCLPVCLCFAFFLLTNGASTSVFMSVSTGLYLCVWLVFRTL